MSPWLKLSSLNVQARLIQFRGLNSTRHIEDVHARNYELKKTVFHNKRREQRNW